MTPSTAGGGAPAAGTSIVLLGTGTPMPDPARCGSGTALVGPDRWILVDCGRGVAQRISEAGLDLAGLEAVLLTHHHSDHVSDLATVATLRWAGGWGDPLIVLAPDGPCARFAATCLDGFPDQAFHRQAHPGCGPRPRIEARPFPATAEPTVVHASQWLRVLAAAVDHHPIEAAVGYRIELADRTVAISGDTAVCPAMEALADGVDVLIHEAVRTDLVNPAVLDWNAGAGPVGGLAERCGVGLLVLTHLLPPPRSADDEAAFVTEARAAGYAGPVTVARDLLTL
jgi:ribonuclease Z